MRIDAFIVLRCTRSEEQFVVFQNLIQSLSVHYPEAKRIVIDDHSTVGGDAAESSRDYLVISSEFSPGSGEILPFFYFHKHGIEWGVETACILHDSVVLNGAFQVHASVKFAPLWHFTIHGSYRFPPFVADSKVISSDEFAGDGCFGAMCILSRHFLHEKVTERALGRLCRKISHRGQRMVVERLIAAMFADKDSVPSLFGNIGHHPYAWKCSPQFLNTLSPEIRSRSPLLKLWYGR
jgi:hypothetical protein